jgi:hypothetical protein
MLSVQCKSTVVVLITSCANCCTLLVHAYTHLQVLCALLMGVPPCKSTQRASASPQSHSNGSNSSSGGESRFTALQAKRRRQTAAGISSSSTPSSPTAAAATSGSAASSDAAVVGQDRPDKLEFDVLMSIVTMAAVAEGGAPLVMLVDSAQHMDEQVRAVQY